MKITDIPLFKYLSFKLTSLSDNLAVETFLVNLGWTVKANGAYKRVFLKRGIPFVIKITRYPIERGHSNHYQSKKNDLLAEFDMEKVFRGVPYPFVSFVPCSDHGGWRRVIAFQPAVKLVLSDYLDKKHGTNWIKRSRTIARIQQLFYDKGNNDCHEDNLGFDDVGRVVQFD